MKNHLTFDVEEAFQGSNFERTIPREQWASLPGRVVVNTERILSHLAGSGLKATFFVVGWVADRYPELVRLLDHEGHEVGAHSYHHRLVYDQSPDEFREDLRRNVGSITSIIGKSVLGYRAPSYTITPRSLWALDILAEEGFLYDSSVYPVRFHPRYGLPGAPCIPYRHENGLLEFPMPVYTFLGQQMPIATGFYFRFMPYAITRALMRKTNARGIPVTVNIHPWELDPGQPDLPGPVSSKVRHYYGLKKTSKRFGRLLKDFLFEPLRDSADQLFPDRTPGHKRQAVDHATDYKKS